MPYYSEDVVDDLLSKVNIVDIIGRFVKLTKKGKDYFGLCPFHSEKTPSFSVSEDKQMYYCFGCHAAGNVITFIKNYENVDFVEAIKIIADYVGVQLPEKDIDPKYKKELSTKRKVYEINKTAANFYFKMLINPSDNAGLNYFRNRLLSNDTIKAFALGYTGKKPNMLYDYLKSKDYDDDILLKTGLFNIDKDRGIKETFWNRVMFPILDPSGNVIGFGGRVLGNALPKYVNTKETDYYSKRRNLYGFSQARRCRDKKFILCEGYMDTISLHQNGFNGAFASLGTALTAEQVKLISSLYRGSNVKKTIYLVYDNDEAGINAKLRAIPMLRQGDLIPKVVDLTPFKDPDEFCIKMGKEEFDKRLNLALDGLIYSVAIKQKDYDLTNPAEKNSFVHNVLVDTIVEIEDSVERKIYIEDFANRYKIDINDLDKLVKSKALNIEYKPNTQSINTYKPQNTEAVKLAQKQIICWLVDNPETVPIIKKFVDENDFPDEMIRNVFNELISLDDIPKNIPSRLIQKYSEDYEPIASLFKSEVKEYTNTEDLAKDLKTVIIKLKEDSINRLSENATPDLETTSKILIMRRAIDDFKKHNITI